MYLLLKTSLFLWTALGFLSSAVKSDDYESSTFCRYVFRDLCYEFVEEPQTWFQAKRDCRGQGGDLLQTMDISVKNFLRSISADIEPPNVNWWLGEAIIGEQQDLGRVHGLGARNEDGSLGLCAYLKLNPLHVVTTPNCSQTHGFLCTHDLAFSPDAQDTEKPKAKTDAQDTEKPKAKTDAQDTETPKAKTRFTRDATEIEMFLETADAELRRMETEIDEPTDESRDLFIQNMLEATKKLEATYAQEHEDVIAHIINCSSAILLISQKKCDLESNPNPKSLFEKVFQIFQAIAVLLSFGSSTPIVIRHPTGTIYQSSYAPPGLDGAQMGAEEDGIIKLPTYSILEPFVSEYDTVVAQMASFTANPHPTDDNISGSVCSFLINNGKADIKLTNLAGVVEVFMPRLNASTAMNSTVELLENTKALTKFNISDPKVTVFFTAEPNANITLRLVLSYGEPPNSTYYSNETFLSPSEGYRWMITPEMFQGSTGVWYIDTQIFNSTWEPGLTLRITSFMTKCMYWDTDLEVWSTSGCRVGEKSLPELTQCLCNHLTLFGSSFFVMPNFVDISRTAELFATVNENYVVLALLCAFYGLYLATLLWACFADRRARSKMKMTLLEDNHPGAQYNYLINVQTGNRKNAGTSSNVTVRLIGSEGESETHNLIDPDKPVFERGAVDLFLLAAPYPLGDLKNLRLLHDNSGGHPSWYINKVTVQDLQTRQVWHFLCGCWLSNDHGDGLTKKTFNAAKNNEIASFRNIFQTRTSTGFRDEHIWVSIVDPPSRSPFTRVQRVSCCMSLLLCTMAINIAFWNIPVNEDSPVLFSFGSLQISWQEIMVGVQSGLLMFPINILIITIFRSIKPRVVIKSRKNKDEPISKPQQVTIPSILKETEEMIFLVSGSHRNKISEHQRLESSSDLCPGLDRVHELIQLMQGELESDPHWVYCSKFLFCCLSHLLMCLGQLNSNNFASPDEYQQALNTTNLLVRKAEMVFTSHMAYCPPPVRAKKKVASCWLPWWCVFLGWFLLLSISGVSTFFTLLYGFQYGKAKSIKWVMSLGLSLFQSIFILQPLKVIGVAVFFALLLRPVALEESEEIEQLLSAQRDKCRQYSGKDTM